jgi:cycloeucalenol cycloisomerase
MHAIFEGKPRWLSDNPDRAWTERFFLLYVPVWVTLFGLWTGVFGGAERGDAASIVFGLVIASPYLIVPALRAPKTQGHWTDAYWFKANVFVFLVNFSGNYFVSEYFFDVLGMIYHYPNLELVAGAALVGSGEQSVPVLMYFMTQATYMTYHTTAVIVMRRVLTSGIPGKLVVLMLLSAVLAYAWAWTETMSFANAALEGSFRYEDKDAMLKYGSIVFGIMLLPSFPIFYLLDEKKERRFSLGHAAAAGLAASWLGLFLTDLCTHVVGTL